MILINRANNNVGKNIIILISTESPSNGRTAMKLQRDAFAWKMCITNDK